MAEYRLLPLIVLKIMTGREKGGHSISSTHLSRGIGFLYNGNFLISGLL